jgi:hypothetical protein
MHKACAVVRMVKFVVMLVECRDEAAREAHEHQGNVQHPLVLWYGSSQPCMQLQAYSKWIRLQLVSHMSLNKQFPAR